MKYKLKQSGSDNFPENKDDTVLLYLANNDRKRLLRGVKKDAKIGKSISKFYHQPPSFYDLHPLISKCFAGNK